MNVQLTKHQQFIQEVLANQAQELLYSPYGKTHFFKVVRKDPRYPKPIAGAGKQFRSVEAIEIYWREVAKTGFQKPDGSFYDNNDERGVA